MENKISESSAMASELVSVIVPMYNVEQYLKQCLDSIVNQSYHNLQIIAVDDGSPDRCGEIAERYAESDSRIICIHKKNEGLGYARNTGLKYATGEYVIFVDSDDWIDSDHIERLVSVAKDKKVDAVVHSYKVWHDANKIVRYPLLKTGRYENVIDEVLYPMLAASDTTSSDATLPVGAWSKLYKRDIIEKNNLLFTNEKEFISEDIFFNIEYLSRCTSVAIVEEYGYNYRMNQNSICNTYNPKRTVQTFLFYTKLKECIAKYNEVASGIGHRAERCFIGKCRSAIKLIEASNLNYFQKRKEVKKILAHGDLQYALTVFPIKNYNAALKYTALAMKYQAVDIVLLLFYIRRVKRR